MIKHEGLEVPRGLERVAIVANVDMDRAVGGVEVHLRTLEAALRDQGCAVRRFGFHGGPQTNILRGRLISGAIGRLAANRFARSVRKAILAWQPTVVWQHDFFANYLAARQLARSLPVVLTNHSAEILELSSRLPARSAIDRLLSHYSLIIGPSTELAEVSDIGGVYIPNGADPAVFAGSHLHEQRSANRRSLYGTSDFTILCARRWAPTKGVLDLVDAVALSEHRGGLEPSSRLVFAGNVEDDYPSYSREVRRRLNLLKTETHILGPLDHEELAEHYRAASLVAFPSRQEAVALGYIEASLAGAPSLCTRVGGFKDVALDRTTALVVEAGRPGELADAIEWAQAHDAELENIGQAAQAIAQQDYTWSTIMSLTIRTASAAVEEWTERRVEKHGGK